jgi:hypothetical protein
MVVFRLNTAAERTGMVDREIWNVKLGSCLMAKDIITCEFDVRVGSSSVISFCLVVHHIFTAILTARCGGNATGVEINRLANQCILAD